MISRRPSGAGTPTGVQPALTQATVADPGKRLAHGRVAQTVLLALMVCGANLRMPLTWDQTAGTTANEGPADAITPPLKMAPGSLAANGLSPPQADPPADNRPKPRPHSGITSNTPHKRRDPAQPLD